MLRPLLLMLLCCCPPLSAEPISRSCYESLPQNFFSRDAVMRALELYNVYQSQWGQIINELHEEGAAIPGIVRGRARRILRDPYTPPEQPDVIDALFLEEFKKLFGIVLQRHSTPYNIINNQTIDQMFLYIQNKNSSVWDTCRR